MSNAGLEQNLAWSPALSVGDVRLDNEHRGILEKMREVRDANSSLMSKEKVLEKYDDLVTLTREHFADEEKYMSDMKYPDIKKHHDIHEQLFITLDRYRGELRKSVYGRFPSSVFDFFNTWITTHIMIVDQQYVKFKNSRELRLKADH